MSSRERISEPDNKYSQIDEPTIEDPFGTKYWYLDGKHHRVNGPAIEYLDGEKHWYLDNKRHRVDGPAAEFRSGTKMWFINDERHRVDGPAIEFFDGTMEWYLDGKKLKKSTYYALLKLRKFRSRIMSSNCALGINFTQTLKLSRNKAVVEWYYSPDNGGGILAKKRLEQFISFTDPL